MSSKKIKNLVKFCVAEVLTEPMTKETFRDEAKKIFGFPRATLDKHSITINGIKKFAIYSNPGPDGVILGMADNEMDAWERARKNAAVIMAQGKQQTGSSPLQEFKKLVKTSVIEVLKEDLQKDEPLYVEYVGQLRDENPFMFNGTKWEYVKAKYPDGKIDIGVYSFAQDLVISYKVFQGWLGK